MYVPLILSILHRSVGVRHRDFGDFPSIRAGSRSRGIGTGATPHVGRPCPASARRVPASSRHRPLPSRRPPGSRLSLLLEPPRIRVITSVMPTPFPGRPSAATHPVVVEELGLGCVERHHGLEPAPAPGLGAHADPAAVRAAQRAGAPPAAAAAPASAHLRRRPRAPQLHLYWEDNHSIEIRCQGEEEPGWRAGCVRRRAGAGRGAGGGAGGRGGRGARRAARLRVGGPRPRRAP